MSDLEAEQILEDARTLHHITVEPKEAALALIRYAMHVGYAEGYRDGKKP